MFVQWLIALFFALIFDIVGHCGFRVGFTNAGNVVSICPEFPALELPFHFWCLFDYLVYLLGDNYSSVLSWAYQMIQQYADIMALVDVDAHASIVASAASGGN